MRPVEFTIPTQGPVTAIEIARAISEVTTILTKQLPLKGGTISICIGKVPAELKTDRIEPMSAEELVEWLPLLEGLLAYLPEARDKSDIYKEMTE